MRKLTGLIGLLLIVCATIFAQPVGQDQVRDAAVKFVEAYADNGVQVADEIVSYQLNNGQQAYHFVLLEPSGWVMVSADERLKPIIGYSFENEFVPMESWEDAAQKWFQKVDRHIESVISQPDAKLHADWKDLDKLGTKKSTSNRAVEPFIPVKWNQSSGWNRFCPEDEEGPGGHAYVGCVAVSMAQAMSVYQYPVQPEGEHGYTHDKYGYIYLNYNNQRPYGWETMSNTSSDDENARLLYHLAVAVDMGFGPDGSGAYTSMTASVLKKYFGYSESLNYISRSSFSDEQWKQMIVDELLNGRPLIYSGDGDNGEAGHAFNIDGVGADGSYFHLNWGWSGSGNGYYTLNALNPGNSNFSYNQAAVIGIKPPSAGPYDITIENLNVFDQQPVGTPVSSVVIADEFDENVYTYKLRGRFNVLLDYYGPAKFFIENDTLKTAEIFDAEKTETEPLIIEVTDSAGNFFRKEFEIAIDKFYYGPTDLTLSDTIVEEGKNPGYFVGVINIEDDIENNLYNFSTIGSYAQANLAEPESFIIKNDSLFTNQVFTKSEGLVYFLEISVTDDSDHLLKKVVEISIVENKSGTASIGNTIANSVSLYPNPSTDFISVSGINNQSARLDLYNMTGQQCFSCNFNDGEMIDLSQLNRGIYMVVIRDGNQLTKHKLIIGQ